MLKPKKSRVLWKWGGWRIGLGGLVFGLAANLTSALEISGQIFSSAANFPLVEVTILVEGEQVAKTDTEGRFYLTDLQENQLVRFQKEAYIDFSTFASKDSENWEIELAPIWSISDFTKVYLDIKQAIWFEEAVRFLYERQVWQERKPTYFLPQELVTRGELIQLSVRAGGFLPPAIQQTSFCDVEVGRNFAAALELAFTQNWIKGFIKQDCQKQRIFKPQNYVTRAEALKIIFEALGDLLAVRLKNKTCLAPGLKDVPTEAWFAKYVTQASCLGLVKGYPDGTFRPKRELNRAELALILAKALDF